MEGFKILIINIKVKNSLNQLLFSRELISTSEFSGYTDVKMVNGAKSLCTDNVLSNVRTKSLGPRLPP